MWLKKNKQSVLYICKISFCVNNRDIWINTTDFALLAVSWDWPKADSPFKNKMTANYFLFQFSIDENCGLFFGQ